MSPYDDQGVAALMPGMAQPAAGMTQPTGSYTGYRPPSYLYQPPPGAYDWGGFAPGQMAAMYNPLAYYSPNNYGYGYTPPNAGYGQGTGTGTGTGTGDGFFHMPGAPTPATPPVTPQINYPQPQHGGRPMAEPTTTNDWTTTSENAYNWSNAGKNLMPVSPIAGWLAGQYGNFLASHVDPNYGHEAMRAPIAPALPGADYSNEGRTQYSPSEAAGAAMQAQQAAADAAANYSNEGRTQYSPSEAVGAAMQAQQANANYSNEGRTQFSPSEAAGAAMRGESGSEGNSLSRDTGGESGGAGKRGGLSKKGKIHPKAFADGGIVDLVRQYPWLLR